MAIKHSITNLEEVEEVFRSHYKPVDAADASKGFVLDVEGAPAPEDTTALKNALQRVREERDVAVRDAKKKGEDVDAVRASFEGQIGTLKKELELIGKKAKEATLDKTVVDLATVLAGPHSGLLVPHIRGRLVMDDNDIIRVLGKDGKASALSLEDLKSEISNDKTFAPVIQAGRASGSGATGGGSSNGGAGGGTGKTTLPPNATISQKVDWLKQQGVEGF